MEIDTSNMCSRLKRKLFEEDGPYHKIWLAMQEDNELLAIRLATLIGFPTKQGISLDDVIPQNVVCSQEFRAFFVEHIGKGFHFKAEFQNWLHNNAGTTYKEAVAAYHTIEHPKHIIVCERSEERRAFVKDHYPDVIVTTPEECTACTGEYGAPLGGADIVIEIAIHPDDVCFC